MNNASVVSKRFLSFAFAIIFAFGMTVPSNFAFAKNSENAAGNFTTSESERIAFIQDHIEVQESDLSSYEAIANTSLVPEAYSVKPAKGSRLAIETEASPATARTSETLESTLLESFDLRDHGYSTGVRSQGFFGTCWVFNALSTLESGLLIQRGGNADSVDLSELQVAFFTDWAATQDEAEKLGAVSQAGEGTTIYGSTLDTGGNRSMITSILARGTGAIDESEAPYVGAEGKCFEWVVTGWDGQEYMASFWDWEDVWEVPRPLATKSTYQLQATGTMKVGYFRADTLFGEAYEAENSDAYIADPSYIQHAKELLMKRGALGVSLVSASDADNTPNRDFVDPIAGGQFCDKPYLPNHEVTIVGWDDSFDRTNFPEAAPADGAWIVKDSHGCWDADEGQRFPWGLNHTGYYYVSYYDASISDVNWLEPVAPEDETSIIQQHDLLGYAGGFKRSISSTESEVKCANVFTADEDMTLESVSIQLPNPNATVDVQVYLLKDDGLTPEDGNLVAEESFSMSDLVYARLDLEKPVKIAAGQRYAVVANCQVMADGKRTWVVPCEAAGISMGADGGILESNTVINAGESFVYAEDEWVDLLDVYNAELSNAENDSNGDLYESESTDRRASLVSNDLVARDSANPKDVEVGVKMLGNVMLKAHGNPAQLSEGEGVYIPEADEPSQPEQPDKPAVPEDPDSSANETDRETGNNANINDSRQSAQPDAPLPATGDAISQKFVFAALLAILAASVSLVAYTRALRRR